MRRIAGELGWKGADPDCWDVHARLKPAARISVPPDFLPTVLSELSPGAHWWASPGVGVAYLAEPDVSQRAAAESVGGSLVLFDGSSELKRSQGAWGKPPATLDVMRRIRDAFDPGRTLSPGRYVV